MAAVLAYIEAK